MEIVNHREKILDVTESNAEGNDNFAPKGISRKCRKKWGRNKKKES